MCKWNRKKGASRAYRNGFQAKVWKLEDGSGYGLAICQKNGNWKHVQKNGKPWTTAEQAKSRGDLELREAEKA